MHIFLFLLFGLLCAGGAINLLIQRKPINSALSLIVVMGSLALIYLLLGAEFVAVVQVIIYAGAIMVLFIFVIMLLNAGEEEHTKGSKVAKIIGIPGLITGFIIGVSVLLQHGPQEKRIHIGELYGSASDVGMMLFTKYLLAFELTSVLVLIAIMGAVVLARRSHSS
ncbi:MAG: NADH-quinone oxidoreductase subunit J [Acidobacteria bacterium]|nr:MAG: NADH-quinone oxidoreductase subunit J [Acidobacteriota bacterium]